jgi:hypothetical protein
VPVVVIRFSGPPVDAGHRLVELGEHVVGKSGWPPRVGGRQQHPVPRLVRALHVDFAACPTLVPVGFAGGPALEVVQRCGDDNGGVRGRAGSLVEADGTTQLWS